MSVKLLNQNETEQFLNELHSSLGSGEKFVSWCSNSKWSRDPSEWHDRLSEGQVRELQDILKSNPTIGAFHAWLERVYSFENEKESLPEPFVRVVNLILASSKSFGEITDAYDKLIVDDDFREPLANQWAGHPNLEPYFLIKLTLTPEMALMVDQIALKLLDLSRIRLSHPENPPDTYSPNFLIHELLRLLIDAHGEKALVSKKLVLAYFDFFKTNGLGGTAGPVPSAVQVIYSFLCNTKATFKTERELFALLMEYHHLLAGNALLDAKYLLKEQFGLTKQIVALGKSEIRIVSNKLAENVESEYLNGGKYDICINTRTATVSWQNTEETAELKPQELFLAESFASDEAIKNGISADKLKSLLSEKRLHSTVSRHAVTQAIKRLRLALKYESSITTERIQEKTIYRFNPKLIIVIGAVSANEQDQDAEGESA